MSRVEPASGAGRKDSPPEKQRRTIVIIASYTKSLVTFRFDLLRCLIEAGHDVYAFAPEKDAATIDALAGIGVRFEAIPMARASLTPFGDLQTLLAIWRKLRRIGPDLVLSYTMKPIIYGMIAARLAGVRNRYAMVTGLGWAFGEHDTSRRRAIVRKISLLLYRVAFVGVRRIFVYNEADARDLLAPGLIREPERLLQIPGTGVNLSQFSSSPPPESAPVFLMIARLLREKGVLDYVAAARRLKKDRPELRFQLLGPLDPNPSGLTKEDVESWARDGAIEYLGETRDVKPYLAACSVFVLPSYYREGIPRTLLEALATGRAVVTTDLPGCRETAEDGRNGFLTPPRDPVALSRALVRFAEEPDLVAQMGAASRALAEELFDVDRVNRILLEEMQLGTINEGAAHAQPERLEPKWA